MLCAAGTYTFTVRITNTAEDSVNSSASDLTVTQNLTGIKVTSGADGNGSSPPSLGNGSSLQLMATAVDQFGNPMSPNSTFTWSAVDPDYPTTWAPFSSVGSISAAGNFTPSKGYIGQVVITAVATNSNNLSGSESITVTDSTAFSENSTYSLGSSAATITVTVPGLPTIASDTGAVCAVRPVFYSRPDITILEVQGPNAAFFTPYGDPSGNTFGLYNISAAEPDQFSMRAYYKGTYSFRLATFSLDGSVQYSQAVSATIDDGLPAAPSGAIVPYLGPYAPSVFWTQTIDNKGSDSVALFWFGGLQLPGVRQIQRSTDGGLTFTTIASASEDSESYIDTDPPKDTDLVYQVCAPYSSSPVKFEPGSGLAASPIMSQTPSLTNTVDNDDGSVTLSWTADPGVYSINGYEVQWSKDGTNYYTIDTVDPSTYTYTDDSPTIGCNSQNYYRVVATESAYDATTGDVEDDATSVNSNTVTATLIAAPVAIDDTDGGGNADDGAALYTTPVGKPLTVDAADGVLTDDYDPQGLTLYVDTSTVVQPDHGSVDVNADGSFTYTPDAGFTGTDSFFYKATNNTLDSGLAEVDVQVANLPVVTQPDSYHIGYNTTLTEPAGVLAANDSNPDNSTLTYRLSPDSSGNLTTQHGTLTFNADGSFTYIPHTGFNGLDHFRYVVNDGTQDSNPSTVVLSVGLGEYTPPVVTTPPTTVPAQVSTFPNSLKVVWQSWQASQGRLAQVGTALGVFGQAAMALQNIDPNSSAGAAAVDKAIADWALANQEYSNYVAQEQATVALCGEYLKSIWFYTSQDDADAIAAVSALPTDICGLNPSRQQLNGFRAAYENFQAGTTWMVADNNYTVQAATATHDALETSVAVGSIFVGGQAFFKGAQLASEAGAAAVAKYAMNWVVTTAATTAATSAISQGAHKLAVISGFSENAIRIGADSFQLVSLLSMAAAERNAAAVVSAGRVTTAQEYFATANVPYNFDSFSQGIDFTKPVETVTLPKGLEVVQYQEPGNPTGKWFAPVGTPSNMLGINDEGVVPHFYTLTEDVTVLRSIADTTLDNPKVPPNAQGIGGGVQYFVNNISAFQNSP